VVVGRLEGRTFTLTRKETRLGKADDCDVVLPGDDHISPHHAVIEQTQKTFVLRPLADPVLVNKQPMDQSHLLKHGDRIQLGRTQVIFNSEGGQK
jgi:pSer/pThr/pTyr-binding forkhead associated (FHA) protein